MTLGARSCPAEALEVRDPAVETSDRMKERIPALLLELGPKIPGAQGERHVVRMLVVGHADHPRPAERGPKSLAPWEAVETKGLQPSFGEVVQSGAAVSAKTDDDRV